MMNKEIDDSNALLFFDQKSPADPEPGQEGYWKILIIDDEDSVHHVTRMVLGEIVFEGKGLELISAYSGREAKEAVISNPDTAVILLDVVMEKEDSGLTFVRYVREVLGNRSVRIVLRTGQPGIAPAEKIIIDYDINDYTEKADLTAQRLFAIIVSSLRSYRNIVDITSVSERLKQESAERLQAEMAFRETQQHLHAMMDNSPAVIYAKNLEGRYYLANREFERLFNIERGAAVGMMDTDLLPPGVAAAVKATDAQVISTGKAVEKEEVLPLADGLHTYLSVKYPLYDAKGAPYAICGIATDITARKKAEELQKQSEESYRLLVGNIPGVVYRGFADGSAEFFDSRVETITSYTMETFASRKLRWLDLVHPEDLPSVTTAFLEALRKDGSYIREYRIRRRDGCFVWIHERGQIVCEESGNIDYVSGVLFDITDRKKAEEDREKLEDQFRQAQKMEAVGRLAGGVAHDFNNMLSVIMGYTELTLLSLKPVDPLYSDIKAVHEAATRSAELTRQLLAFSRRQTIAPKVLNLSEQTRGMERLLARIIGEDIDLVFKLSDVLWSVYMDPAQIDQIVVNLVINSRDAMPDGGKLTVETSNIALDERYCEKHLGFTPGDFVMVAVSDTGCGMDKETLEHVFEPFFTTKPEGKGTGLGLATIYGIAKQNNGFLNIYSEPGQGTTIKIFIPRFAGQEETAPATDLRGSLAGGRETVLLVEDEDQVRRLAKTILQELNYTVFDASDPEEAITFCQKYQGQIHLLLTDVVMPNMSGKELQRRIKATRPDIRTLYMSGYTANAIAHRGVLEKGVQFLQKPFSVEVIARKVREVLNSQGV